MTEFRKATIYDWDEAIELVWKTFLKYEARDYGREGIRSFQNFLSDPLLRRMFLLGEYPVFVAVEAGGIVGVIGLRNRNHISLLFVESEHQRSGIGKRLIDKMAEYVREEEKDCREITVNAAPFAVGFYHKIGFRDTSMEQIKEGIRYTPMKKMLDSDI